MDRKRAVLIAGMLLVAVFASVVTSEMVLSPAPVAAGFTPTPVPTDPPTDTPTEVPEPDSGTGPQPSLWVSKEADASVVAPGETFTYRIVVQNDGPGTATGVMLQDDVPSELEIVDVSVTQGTTSVNGNQVTVDVGTLGAGYFSVLTITVRVKLDVLPGTEIENTVVAWSDQIDEIIARVVVKVTGGAFLPESGGRLSTDLVMAILGSILVLAFGLYLYLSEASRCHAR